MCKPTYNNLHALLTIAKFLQLLIRLSIGGETYVENSFHFSRSRQRQGRVLNE